MGSKRDEERNEKIIRGLMKLPPNRRCINCNSLGPQYVCTNFWSFVCMPCSGVHREFTHRVKSVSMAKFTSQEVDALQKGGNQRARELFLNAWDPQSQRLPDNSNPDKVREFIKHVYVDKRYAIEKLSDKPPRDPQTIRSREDETRRASSYHSYSQSPPYDFQYEERRYGKPVSSLSRKPGSDRGLYEGKVSSFSSPGHSSDQAYDERFANEGSWPRVSDYSVSSGGDPFRSDALSPSSQKETWSPFSESETSSNLSSEIHGQHTSSLHSANSLGGNRRVKHPLRTTSTGSIGSFDSMSFKSVNSTGLQDLEAEAEARQSIETSHENALPFPSLPQSSASTIFNGLDLFNEPFAPQNITSNPTTVPKSQSPESLLPLPLDLFQQPSISSAPSLTEQQPSETLQSSTLNFTSSLSDIISDVAIPRNGGWATFDVSQNSLNMGSENSIHAVGPSSDVNILRDLNTLALDPSTSIQNPQSLEISASAHTLWQENLQNAEATTSNNQVWNAFNESGKQHPIEYKLEDRIQTPVLYDSIDNTFLGSGHELLQNDGNLTTSYGIEPPSSSLSLHPSMPLHSRFSLIPEAGVPPVATAHKPMNPFDLPCDGVLAPNDMTQFWDVSSLQATLPDNQATNTYAGDLNESWFAQGSIPSYIPGCVAFDPPNDSMVYMAGQVTSTQISSGSSQGPVASIGGNPFA